MRLIKIHGEQYSVNDSQEAKDSMFDKLVAWVQEQNAWGGEKIMQCDDCLIDAPLLVSDIVDKILKPTPSEQP